MNIEERKAYRKAYRESHKESLKEYYKKYNETHKEQRKKSVKKYNETHKEQRKKSVKKYYESHKEYFKEAIHKYRSTSKGKETTRLCKIRFNQTVKGREGKKRCRNRYLSKFITAEGIKLSSEQIRYFINPLDVVKVPGYWAMAQYKLEHPDSNREWCLHHTREYDVLTDTWTSEDDLKKQGLYYHRPWNEFRWMTASAHTAFHWNDPSRRTKNANPKGFCDPPSLF